MSDAPLCVKRGNGLCTCVFTLTGVHADDAAAEPGITQRIFRHIAALVGFDDDRISFVLLVGLNGFGSPAVRRILPAVIRIEAVLSFIAGTINTGDGNP